MKSILTGPIRHLLCFNAPAVADAPPAGGGGGGTSAAADTDPALKAGNDDVLGYQPPGLDDIDLGDMKPDGGKKPDDDAAAKEAAARAAAEGKAATEKAAAEKKAADEKAAAERSGTPPIEHLRSELKKTQTELEALRETAAKGDPRVKELEAERDAQKKELEDARKDIEVRKAREMEHDPEVIKPLKDLDSDFEKRADRFYNRVDSVNHDQVKQLLPKFLAIKKGTEGAEARREEFKQSVNKALGVEGEETHPDFDKVRDWIADVADFASQRNEMVADLRKNAASRFNEVQSKSYTTKKAELAKQIEAAKIVPEGMETTTPTHPKVVLHAVLKSLKPEQVAALTKGVPEFIELAQLGVPPRTDKDFVGMTAEQITEARGEEERRVAAARAHIPEVVYNGMIALRVVGALMRDNAKLRERLGEKRESDPPDPGGDGKDGKQVTTGDDLTGFKPPSLDSMNY